MQGSWLRAGIAALLLSAAGTVAAAALPDVPNHVLDQTGTLDAGQVEALERKLADYETGGGAQVVVVLVPTTQPDSIEQYAVALFEKNAFGRKGKDDAVLLLVAKDDRAVRIEVGYGLEGAIPDLYANRIIEERLVPAFRAGDIHGGIDSATNALISLAEAERTGVASVTKFGAPVVPMAPVAEDAYVHDVDGRLEARLRTALAQKLAVFEQRTGHRIMLVLLGYAENPLPSYATDMLERHPPAQPGAYAVIVASGGDDRADVFIGDVLKPTIGAAEQQRIVSEALVPKLATDRDYAALDAASDVVIARIDGVEPPAKHDVTLPPSDASPAMSDDLVPLLVMLLISILAGLFAGSLLVFLPRLVRAPFGAAAAAYFVGTMFLQDAPWSKELAVAALAGAFGAFIANKKWIGSGSSGGSRSYSSGSSRSSSSSSSSSGRSSGGRSGGGGASGRW